MNEVIQLRKKIFELEQNECRFKHTEKSGKIGGWQFDPETLKQKWTDEVFRILEFDLELGAPEVPQGMKFIDLDFRPMAEKAIQQAMENGVPYDQEWMVTTAKGNKKWVNAVCNPKIENGKVISVSGSFQDITSRKIVQEELKMSEQQLKDAIKKIIEIKGKTKKSENALKHSHDLMKYIIEHNRSGIAVHDKEFKYIYVSQRYLQDYQLKKVDVIGKYHYDVFPDLPQKWRDVHKKALLGEVSSADVDPYYKDDGTFEWTRWECRPWYEDDDTIGGYVVYTEVITKRKEMELAIKASKEKAEESESRYRNLVETALDAIYLLADDGIVIDTNQSAIDMLGKPRDEIIGQSILSIDPSYSVKEFLDFWEDIPFDKQQIFETTHQHKNGNLIPVELSAKKYQQDGKTYYYSIARNITDRKNSEEALIESEKRFQSLSEAAFEAIFFSEKGLCIDQNSSAEKMFGYTLEEALGRLGTEWIAPEDREKVMNNMISGNEGPYEATALRKDGFKFPVEIRARNSLYKGKMVRVTALVDITVRKKAGQELIKANEKAEASEQNLKEAQNLAKLGNWELDLINNKLRWSDEVYSIFGREPQEFAATYDAFLSFIHPEDRDFVDSSYKNHLESKQPYNINHRILLPNNNIKYVNERCKSDFDENNNPLRSIGTIVDITESVLKQKEIEENKTKAEENKANITAIIEGTNNSIWAFNRSYQVLYINHVFQEEFFQTFGVFLEPGMSLIEALPESLQPFWKPRYDRILSNEQFTIEDAVPTPNGTIYIQVSFNPIVKDGQVIGGSCFGSNITSRKLAEIELIEAKERAESANIHKNYFLANMSHEIRTPMNGVLGFTNLLLEEDFSAEERYKYLHIIERNSLQLLTLIDDIIDIAKIESNELNISLSSCSLFDILNDLEENFNQIKLKLNKEQIELKLEIPFKHKDLVVITDGHRLRQVISNLLNNAFKFSEKGTITFGFKVEKSFIEFYVSDQGIGIPEEKLTEIFERFKQLNYKNAAKYGGTGLGLAISRGIIKMLGGKVSVKSEDKIGSTFTFSLPFNDSEKHKKQK